MIAIVTRVIVVGIVFMSLSSCSKKLQVADAQEAQKIASESKLVSYLERTPCYGKCPVYKIEIYDNGLVTYEGIRFTEKIGKYYGIIKEIEVQAIIDMALEIGYFEMADVYPTDETPPQDLPQTITMVTNGDVTQKVINKNYNSPEILKKLENYIDETVAGVDWALYDSKMAE
ncbi:MAG: hypothetical protein HKN22_05975 [Bacteroidia bacterium]|nr:hypothetical protein [Bacteroidia bacterium]